MPSCYVQSLRATRNGRHVAAPPAVLHAANRGANAGDDIASNTRRQAELTRLAAAVPPGSPSSSPQTMTLRARRLCAVSRAWAF
jgi:hypothetical protein